MNHQSRTLLLATMAIATAFTLAASRVGLGTRTVVADDYTFPESIALSQWQQVSSQPLKPHAVAPTAYISGDFIAGRHYRYRRDNKLLDIEMRYFTNTNGDIKNFITSQTGNLSSGLRHDERGTYSIYIHDGKAYLSACLNSRGGSTVTSDGFNRNRLLNDARIKSVLPWLLGKAGLQDKRCLWAHLSTQQELATAVDETYLTLETVWSDWHNWWRSHYPILPKK